MNLSNSRIDEQGYGHATWLCTAVAQVTCTDGDGGALVTNGDLFHQIRGIKKTLERSDWARELWFSLATVTPKR